MSDKEPSERDDDPTPYWWKIERKALMSDIRLLIIASVALNQFLANVTLPDGLSTGAIAVAIFAPAIKALGGFFLGR